ncbi:hypothetical protein H6G81_34485 [Scytonema hofmannii FACHB-248]|uniref:Uncharacterized protein n=1 Tax=Scytonema hofmannii FACHB-248 TaxID=1842502 RepID=A0ABR8H1R7_9CYAN|nr:MULTISPECIES: hypothetical protein [Nostocales]MBD2609464.1 hypothetical protein [Scytonema hofmannii FACHB-248]
MNCNAVSTSASLTIKDGINTDIESAIAQLQEFISDDQENPTIHNIAGFAFQTSPTKRRVGHMPSKLN